MIIHSKVLGRDFSCDAKDAAETMKAVLALEAAAKAEEEDDFLASALNDVLTELDKNYDEQDKLEAEIDELEAKIAEVESKLSEVYDRIEELEAEEVELEELIDELTDEDDDDDCCEWDCDCDDCPDKEACYEDDEKEDVSPYHCAAVIIKNGDEEKRVPADFSAVIDAILEMLEDEEDDLGY